MINKLKTLDIIALVFVIIGGLNWAFVAFSPNYNLVEMLLGSIPALAQFIYLLIGLAAIYLAVVMYKFARK
ncbi:DUF378 domain-containing protein [Patescibacteria group bacterium]|nr:DUF378 domain-containing protein [Patescibacteria group bacterium]